jgi:DNA-binding MarR family transcriptional regulator
MKIEEVIKSSQPIEDLYHRAYLNVIYSAIWLEEVSLPPLKELGLTHPQYNVLRIVNGYKGLITVASIQSRMLFKKSNVTRIIDRLIEKGLLAKANSPRDRRVVLVNITELGKVLLANVHHKIHDLVRGVMSKNLSLDEVKQLGLILDKMRA